jgi:hypothetical protein
MRRVRQMPHQQMDRGHRTPEEAAGYRDVIAEALPKCRDWPQHGQKIGYISVELEVSIKPVWEEHETQRYIFGISDEERLPTDKPYVDGYLLDPDIDR